MLNNFEMMKRTLKNVLRTALKTCKSVSRKPCINREDESERSQFIYTAIFVIIKMNLLAVITQPSIYQLQTIFILYMSISYANNFRVELKATTSDIISIILFHLLSTVYLSN